jgi:hypothetical protein
MDEKLGESVARLLRAGGHDVATVPAQGLSSAADAKVIDVCRNEGRCLLTLDMDFPNPLVFRPRDYRGIAVLRLPPKPSHVHLIAAAHTFAAHLAHDNIMQRLWIIEIGRVRIYQDEEFEIDQMMEGSTEI